jgi:hypothetical protein
MQFDPKYSFYLGIVVTIEIAISHGTIGFTNAIPAAWIPTVVAWAGILAFVGSTVMTYMAAFSSAQAGPLVTPPAPGAAAPKAVIAILAIGLSALALAWAQPARAQVKAAAAPQKPVFCDLLNLIPGCQANPDFISSVKSQLGQPSSSINSFSSQQIADKIGKLALADFIYADALAKSTNNVVTQPCWAAWVKLLTQQQAPLIGPALTEQVSWPGSGAVFSTASPHNLMVGQGITFTNPPAGLNAVATYFVIAENFTADTFEVSATAGGAALVPTGPASMGTALTSAPQILQHPDPGLVTNVEYLSEAVQLLQSNSPIAVACAPMAQALQKDVANLLGQIITGGAFGLFKLPIPIGPIP